jgi:hypothetical protein
MEEIGSYSKREETEEAYDRTKDKGGEEFDWDEVDEVSGMGTEGTMEVGGTKETENLSGGDLNNRNEKKQVEHLFVGEEILQNRHTI